MSSNAGKQPEAEPSTKPKSRLLAMKERLKSQRKTNHDKTEKTSSQDKATGGANNVSKKENSSKKSSLMMNLSVSRSFSENNKTISGGASSTVTTSTAKKSLFGSKHKKSQSADVELSKSSSSMESKSSSNILKRNKKTDKSSSSKLLKSQSFDMDNCDARGSVTDERLNKSVDEGGSVKNNSHFTKKANGYLSSASSISKGFHSSIGKHFGFGFHHSSKNNNNSSSSSPKTAVGNSDVKYQIHKKIENGDVHNTSSTSVKYTLKPKIKASDGQNTRKDTQISSETDGSPVVNSMSSTHDKKPVGGACTSDTSRAGTEVMSHNQKSVAHCRISSNSSEQRVPPGKLPIPQSPIRHTYESRFSKVVAQNGDGENLAGFQPQANSGKPSQMYESQRQNSQERVDYDKQLQKIYETKQSLSVYQKLRTEERPTFNHGYQNSYQSANTDHHGLYGYTNPKANQNLPERPADVTDKLKHLTHYHHSNNSSDKYSEPKSQNNLLNFKQESRPNNTDPNFGLNMESNSQVKNKCEISDGQNVVYNGHETEQSCSTDKTTLIGGHVFRSKMASYYPENTKSSDVVDNSAVYSLKRQPLRRNSQSLEDLLKGLFHFNKIS